MVLNYRQHKNILLEKYKVVFYSIPKNACSSMKSQIIETLGMKKGPQFPIDVHNPEVYPYPFVLSDQLNNQYSDYLRFCIARNPWDRLVSCYKDKIRPVDFNSEGYIDGVALPLIENSPRFYGGMSFEEFVAVVCDIPDSIAEHHFTSQLYLITDNMGNLLVNYIGKLETLKEDLDVISKKSGFPFTHFPHHRKTEKKAYQDYYTDELIEKVAARYASDIGFFNYEYGHNNNLTKIGFITDKLNAKLSNSKWLIPVLKQKNLFVQKTNQNVISSRNKRIEALNHELKIKKRELSGIENSMSWKITSPLRKLVKILGFTPKE